MSQCTERNALARKLKRPSARLHATTHSVLVVSQVYAFGECRFLQVGHAVC